MYILLQGTLAQHRHFVSEVLPTLVYQMRMDSACRRQPLRTLTERFASSVRVIADTPEVFEASILLGRASHDWLNGRRRIGIRTTTIEQQTQIEVVETMNGALVMCSILAGFFLFLVPGVIVLFAHLMHSSRNRQVIAQVGSMVKQAYPDAVVSDY